MRALSIAAKLNGKEAYSAAGVRQESQRLMGVPRFLHFPLHRPAKRD